MPKGLDEVLRSADLLLSLGQRSFGGAANFYESLAQVSGRGFEGCINSWKPWTCGVPA